MDAPEYTGPWSNLVEEELIETNATLTFHFNQSIEVQFLRFELLSQQGGGLNFFSPIAGNLCISIKITKVYFSKRFLLKSLGKPALPMFKIFVANVV